ncbi:hypothetical protein K504DRAFT_252064 [Pleomassaria siparia CBS 279.74]|uniref:Uncharacterized protein n=1 Tax=Pleomassaria siparia CBS 279.74 TaxID=1314801 RepID=A0A6G1KBC7_9PLEO|nr:hypothetical protein K504DRAFT_252064 [Pleomassaria siparia CBS 279.74]
MSSHTTSFRFLDLPVTVRDQIYTELLVPPIIRIDHDHVTQERLSVEILHVNKQIYAESSDVLYAKNLLIVISANSPALLDELTRDKTPIISEPKDPRKIVQCHRFAMNFELVGIGCQLCATSTPMFVISAKALPLFATALIGEYKFRPGIGMGLAQGQITVKNTFRYTTERFSDLTFGRLLEAEEFPQFNCLRVVGAILDEHRRALARDFVDDSEHACGIFALGMDSYRHRVWFGMRNEDRTTPNEGFELSISEHQTHELPRLMIRQYDMFWDCHNYRVRELGHVCTMETRYQFTRMAEMYNTLIEGYILAAKRDPDQAVTAYTQALRAAEEGITYLNRDDRFAEFYKKDEPVEGDNMVKVQAAKTMLSLKASKACSKLGDKTSAVKYVQIAHRCTPHMFPRLQERLLKLAGKIWPAEPMVIINPIFWKDVESE